MRTGDSYRIPPALDQCQHCGAIFYSPSEAAFCVVYEQHGRQRHEHLCAVHARQVVVGGAAVNEIVYAAEIPIRKVA